MTDPTQTLSDFPPLPGGAPARDTSANGRRVGIEIEFGGLAPEAAARCLTERFGGDADQQAPGDWIVRDTEIGEVALYLDTKFRPETDSALARAGVELGRTLLPMEIVTEPLEQKHLPALDALMDDLTEAGALGSADGVLFGFGLHLNIELADTETGADLPRVALAYALLERWLRRRDPPDIGRRVLPFTDPFPARLVTDLATAGTGLGRNTLFDLLTRHGTTRNHGLDLLPAWASVAPDSFAAHEPDTSSVSARPAYHYRLPDCRLGLPGWSLAYEWRRWVLIERVADDRALLADLADLWLKLRDAPLLPDRPQWQEAVTERLGAHAALAPEGGPDARGA